jgi:hypothetical protein
VSLTLKVHDCHIVTEPRHAGPILPGCPIDCLRLDIPTAAFNALARAYGASFPPPVTAGDVAGLYRQGRLSEICSLGPRRIAQIEAGLTAAGLIGARAP